MTSGVSTFSQAAGQASSKIAILTGAIGGLAAGAAISLLNVLSQLVSFLVTLPIKLATSFAR